jgi:hypothetical protein
MSQENPLWGAPRIHGELLKLGFEVAPTILTNGPGTRKYRVLVNPRDWTSGFISRADVADFLVRQTDDANLFHRTPAVTGSL